MDTESVLFMSGLLAEKTDSANVTSADARKVALTQLQKIMFGDNPINDKAQALPARGTVHREWLDIGTNQQKGPSPAMMQKKTGMAAALALALWRELALCRVLVVLCVWLEHDSA